MEKHRTRPCILVTHPRRVGNNKTQNNNGGVMILVFYTFLARLGVLEDYLNAPLRKGVYSRPPRQWMDYSFTWYLTPITNSNYKWWEVNDRWEDICTALSVTKEP